MANLKDKLKNTKDKVSGEVKDKFGKMTDNETLELKGKIQSTKADISKELSKGSIRNKVEDIKEDIAGKINHIIDKED